MRFAAAQAGLPALDAKQELRSNMLVDTMTEIFDKTVGPAFAAANAGAPEGELIIFQNRTSIIRHYIRYFKTKRRISMLQSKTVRKKQPRKLKKF